MKKHSFLLMAYAACTTLLFTAIGCGSNESGSTPAAKSDSAEKTQAASTPQSAPSPAPALGPLESNYLDTLFVDATPFKNLGNPNTKKITFRFFITNKDSLTLHGWFNESNSSSYGTPPDMKLINGHKSDIEFGMGNYLGNLVLYKDDLKTIRKMARDMESKFVVFVPVAPGTNGGQIMYAIHVSDKTGTFSKTTVVPTGTETNPSPPRNAN